MDVRKAGQARLRRSNPVRPPSPRRAECWRGMPHGRLGEEPLSVADGGRGPVALVMSKSPEADSNLIAALRCQGPSPRGPARPLGGNACPGFVERQLIAARCVTWPSPDGAPGCRWPFRVAYTAILAGSRRGDAGHRSVALSRTGFTSSTGVLSSCAVPKLAHGL
jgi:hypothetical protein